MDDLKDYREQNGFVLFTDDGVLIILGVIFAGCMLIDFLQRVVP